MVLAQKVYATWPWKFLAKHNIKCTARHIPGVKNVIADSFSRSKIDIHDFGIKFIAFQFISSNIPFPLHCDLFASRLTAKLKNYVSRFHDPYASKVDAFSFQWVDHLYIFPPISLLPRVVTKFLEDSALDSCLVTPAWPGLSVFPILVGLLVSNPIFIHTAYLDDSAPSRFLFHLMVWPISTAQLKQRAYQETLLTVSSKALPLHLCPAISDIGNSLLNSLTQLGHKVKLLLP